MLWLSKGLGAGGAENLLLSLARTHDRDRVELAAGYVVGTKTALVPALKEAGVEVHHLGGRSWVLSLAALLRRERFDVVHAHSPLVSAAARVAVALTAPRRGQRPALVSTEHNAWGRRRLATTLANAVTIHRDAAVLAVSDEVRDSIWWPSTRRRCRTLVHGIDLDAAASLASERDSVRRELGIGPEEVVVATVANLRVQKAWPDMLRAARTALDLADAGRDPGGLDLAVRFVGVGQGPLEGEVRGLHARLGLEGRFLFLGYRPDAVRILAGADIFTLASTWEGYPVALMEAMALGLPVVATAVGGVADAVRPGVEGDLVAAGRPSELAGTLVALAGEPERRARYSAASRARASLFDIRRAARELEYLYERLCATTDRR